MEFSCFMISLITTVTGQKELIAEIDPSAMKITRTVIRRIQLRLNMKPQQVLKKKLRVKRMISLVQIIGVIMVIQKIASNIIFVRKEFQQE